MRILDLLKRSTATKPRELLLDESATAHWPRLLVEYQELDKEFKTFLDNVERFKAQARQSIRKFTDENILAAIPDRARTINALHGKEYASQVEKLLKTEFTDIFAFEQQQERYFEQASIFKDQSSKHISVLKEFMHDELKETQGSLQQLEDAVIHFLKLLEERKFPTIRKLHDSNIKLQQMTERQEKYQRLLESLQTDLKRTQEKRQKIEDDILEQQKLVRNDNALVALNKMKQLEQDIFHTAMQYSQLAKDLQTLYSKKEMRMNANAKKATDELQKDASAYLVANAENVKNSFESITAQLEDENLGNRNLFERLGRLAANAEADGRRIATSGPDIRTLKKDMMRDVAALQIYDKQQFLLRAQAEENTIRMKLEYLQQELDPNKRLVLEQEMKDAAKSFGALIKAKEQPSS